MSNFKREHRSRGISTVSTQQFCQPCQLKVFFLLIGSDNYLPMKVFFLAIHRTSHFNCEGDFLLPCKRQRIKRSGSDKMEMNFMAGWHSALKVTLISWPVSMSWNDKTKLIVGAIPRSYSVCFLAQRVSAVSNKLTVIRFLRKIYLQNWKISKIHKIVNFWHICRYV